MSRGLKTTHNIVKDPTILQTLPLNSVLQFNSSSASTVTALFLETRLEGEHAGEMMLSHIYIYVGALLTHIAFYLHLLGRMKSFELVPLF